MDISLKYQYTYFIYPYVIEKATYTEYLYKLFKDPKCKLKLFEKEKDIDIYSYFSFNARTCMFQSFEFDKQNIKDIEEMDVVQKVKVLGKMPAISFEYEIPENIHGKTQDQNSGIFFQIQKIQLVVFNTGVCFLLLKTNLEETTKFKDLLEFNYKFRLINYEKNGIKQAENIKVQTNAFSSISQLMDLILDVTGESLRKNEDMESFTDKFFTYSYACVDQENWNENVDFNNIKDEFYKFSNILTNDYNNYKDITEEDKFLAKDSKYVKFGFNRYGATVLSSGIDTYNYTKLPDIYENEYLYTLLICLYQKIYINKLILDLRSVNTKDLEKAREQFVKFTKTVWFKEITNNEIGIKLYKIWQETLDIDASYDELKDKYNIIYKSKDLEDNKKLNNTLIVIITIAFIINVITFIIFRMLM